MSLAGGSRIGPYEVLGRLGEGGMGEVYRARDTRLGREVAIKMLSAAHLDARSRGRFEREARLASAVSHANVLALHDVGEYDGLPYLVTELLQGETLRELIAAGPTPWRTAIPLALQIAEGLAAAHEKGIVHRDLKPENVFLTAGGQVKILDFGIARMIEAEAAERAPGAPMLTATGTAPGTPAYMSPEQLRAERVDARSDLFSFGCVLYELLCGRRPFVASTDVDVAFDILHREPEPLPKATPDRVARLVSRCLQKRPEDRWQTARELASALRGSLGPEGADSTATLDRAAAAGPPAPAGEGTFARIGVSLFAELKRRRVLRALIGYGIAAFAVLQIIEPLMHGLHWPEHVLAYVVVALAAGFPLVVGIAWIFDTGAPVPLRLHGAKLALVLAGIGVLAAAPGLAWYFVLHPRPAPTAAPPSIAVLPFVDMSAQKDQGYFADGLSEEILDALAQVEGLHVAGRTSSFSFRQSSDDLRTIGERLNVASVLEGSVRKEGSRVRIDAQLINAADGFRLWSQRYDRELTGIFAAQDEIARAVVQALRVRLVPGAKPSARPHTSNPEAYNEYLLGKERFRGLTRESYAQSIDAYQRAIALDPGFAAAWAGLAVSTFWLSDDAPSKAEIDAGYKRAMEAAEKTVALAPDLAEGYSVRGFLRGKVSWDWAGAQADLERALALNPGDADAHLRFASVVLWPLGRLNEAMLETRKAAELDPLSPVAWLLLGISYYAAGQLAPAREAFERSLRISPRQGYAAVFLCSALLIDHQPALALAAGDRSPHEMVRSQCRAMALFTMGRGPEARALLEQFTPRYAHEAAYQFAEIWSWMGERDRAFEWLERAYAQHDSGLPELKVDPLLRGLHGDPRFQSLLQRMHLPED